MKLILLTGIAITGLAVLGGVAYRQPGAIAGIEKIPASVSETPLTVTAAQLSRAFQDDERKAKLAYGERRLRVSGVVVRNDLTAGDIRVIDLRGSAERRDKGMSPGGRPANVMILGIPQEMSGAIREGKSMTFDCSGAHQTMGITQIEDCSVA